MKKLKIYLDTSVISHLDALDVPEKMLHSKQLWKRFVNGDFVAVVSDITLDEINRCNPEKLGVLLGFLEQIEYTVMNVTDETIALAEKIADLGVLKQKSFDDCTHIAAAIVNDCDIIASWNFKHIVNYKTIQGVKIITTAEGYKDVMIYSPTIIVEGETDNE